MSGGYNEWVDWLRTLPAIYVGQCCDCKVEEDETRVWLCRVGGGVTTEHLIDGCWKITEGGCNE